VRENKISTEEETEERFPKEPEWDRGGGARVRTGRPARSEEIAVVTALAVSASAQEGPESPTCRGGAIRRGGRARLREASRTRAAFRVTGAFGRRGRRRTRRRSAESAAATTARTGS
jgi:hypothetical protein